ncbi:unnamed protein product [Caenorhabditis angaria]|uniref:Mitogen-activated protein kinase kinase kinase n=1 Tax=Caenorhabditis angaria TaxID=860376 RepID=A0A9P1N7A3_9PELO|nr:unnamed protein product [Caenorhabditis angaria]
MEPEFRPYVNLPPMTKTRSTSHLAPITPEHHRSTSCEDSASSSSESAVRIRQDPNLHRDSNIPSRFVVAYEYEAQKEDELNLPLGSIVRLITTDTNEDGWYKGDLDGRIGLFPSNYVRPIGEESNLLEFPAKNIQIPPQFQYLEQAEIGRGATATVFKIDLRVHAQDAEGMEIFDEFTTEKAALKRFNYHILDRTRTSVPPYEMLKREANLVNGLQHPNIVRLLGVCTEKPYFGLLLELCEGGSLRRVYHDNKQKTIPFRVLVDWALQIASGMEYLISQGYVHRDLKADNVLVKEEVCTCITEQNFEWCPDCGGRPFDRLKLKITDFGVTRELTAEAINRQSQVGTCAWLSPEAFHGTYSEASDIWSFGVVLWELLSKEEPYQGQVPASIMFQTGICGKSLEIDKNCPQKWRDIMQKCWNFRPESRPKFQELVKFFQGYKRELEEIGLVQNSEMDTQLKEAQVKIAQEFKDIYWKCSADQRNLLDQMIQQLYAPISGIERSKRASVAPATKARKKKKKPEISGPVGSMKHIYSIKVEEGSGKDQKNQFKFYDYSTLPRSFGKNAANFSASSPDLNLITDLTPNSEVAPKISRQKAIRKKHGRNSTDFLLASAATSPISDDLCAESMFAQIDNADDVVLIESTSKDNHHHHNHHSHHPKNGTFSRVLSKLPWKSSKRDSRDDDSTNASPITTRSSSSTNSSSRHQNLAPIFTGPHSRAPIAASQFLANRAQSEIMGGGGEDLTGRKNKVSPTGEKGSSRNNGFVKHTNLTERFTKEDPPSRPAQLHTNHQRKSVLDQPIPQSSPTSNSSPMSVMSSRRNTSSQDFPPPPNLAPTLSTYIPVGANEPTHYLMSNGYISAAPKPPHFATSPQFPTYLPVGGGCDDYIRVSGGNSPHPPPTYVAIGRNTDVVNNTQIYTNDFLAQKIQGLNVVNPQYYQCKPKNGGGGSLAGKNHHLGAGRGNHQNSDDEPPDHPAPPPPPISMAPPTIIAPVIPPR